MTIRLEDCTEAQRRLLLALVANRKSAGKRTADAANAPTVLEVERVNDAPPRRRAA